MPLLLLKVVVEPWKDEGNGTLPAQEQDELLPWVEPVPPDSTLAQLPERIIKRFASVHSGRGELRIKRLHDGYEGPIPLETSILIQDFFVDRSKGGTDERGWTVRVVREAPSTEERRNLVRCSSVFPESTLRPPKRPYNSILGIATPNDYSHVLASGVNGTGATNKRQRFMNGPNRPNFDPDQPIISEERDRLPDSAARKKGWDQQQAAFVVPDSQHSPVQNRQLTYATPQSLSISSVHGLAPHDQAAEVTILDSPPRRGRGQSPMPIDSVQAPDADEPKSESPEQGSLVHSVAPSNRDTPRASSSRPSELAASKFTKPALPGVDNGKTAHHSAEGVLKTQVRIEGHKTPRGQQMAQDPGDRTIASSATTITAFSAPLKNPIRQRKPAQNPWSIPSSPDRSSPELPGLPSSKRTKLAQPLPVKSQPDSRVSVEKSSGTSRPSPFQAKPRQGLSRPNLPKADSPISSLAQGKPGSNLFQAQSPKSRLASKAAALPQEDRDISILSTKSPVLRNNETRSSSGGRSQKRGMQSAEQDSQSIKRASEVQRQADVENQSTEPQPSNDARQTSRPAPVSPRDVEMEEAGSTDASNSEDGSVETAEEADAGNQMDIDKPAADPPSSLRDLSGISTVGRAEPQASKPAKAGEVADSSLVTPAAITGKKAIPTKVTKKDVQAQKEAVEKDKKAGQSRAEVVSKAKKQEAAEAKAKRAAESKAQQAAKAEKMSREKAEKLAKSVAPPDTTKVEKHRKVAANTTPQTPSRQRQSITPLLPPGTGLRSAFRSDSVSSREMSSQVTKEDANLRVASAQRVSPAVAKKVSFEHRANGAPGLAAPKTPAVVKGNEKAKGRGTTPVTAESKFRAHLMKLNPPVKADMSKKLDSPPEAGKVSSKTLPASSNPGPAAKPVSVANDDKLGDSSGDESSSEPSDEEIPPRGKSSPPPRLPASKKMAEATERKLEVGAAILKPTKSRKMEVDRQIIVPSVTSPPTESLSQIKSMSRSPAREVVSDSSSSAVSESESESDVEPSSKSGTLATKDAVKPQATASVGDAKTPVKQGVDSDADSSSSASDSDQDDEPSIPSKTAPLTSRKPDSAIQPGALATKDKKSPANPSVGKSETAVKVASGSGSSSESSASASDSDSDDATSLPPTTIPPKTHSPHEPRDSSNTSLEDEAGQQLQRENRQSLSANPSSQPIPPPKTPKSTPNTLGTSTPRPANAKFPAFSTLKAAHSRSSSQAAAAKALPGYKMPLSRSVGVAGTETEPAINGDDVSSIASTSSSSSGASDDDEDDNGNGNGDNNTITSSAKLVPTPIPSSQGSAVKKAAGLFKLAQKFDRRK